jgi:broad specificity phosphatase PhoE
MTTILLARHGQSDWNAAGRWQGHADRPLTELGRRQAELLAAELAGVSLDAAYASDLRRAWETAEIALGGRRLEIVRLPELREVDVGSWSGLSRAEVAERFPEAFERWRSGGHGWEDGEPYEVMAARVVAAVHRIAGAHPGGRILAVSHGGPIRALKAHALAITVGDHRLVHAVEDNAAVSAIVVENGSIKLLD